MAKRKSVGIRLGKGDEGEKCGNTGKNINKNKAFRKIKNRIVNSKNRLRH